MQAARAKWRETLDIIRELRKERDAPVDSLGAESVGDATAPPEVFRFQVLTGVFLSSQTKDPVTAQAVKNLIEFGLTVDNIIATDEQKIDELISKVGFHAKKAKNLKIIAQTLKDKYNGDVPASYDDLVQLPGIGPKMTHIILNVAFGVVSGIGVDTHVHRVANALEWVKAKYPEGTREQLQSFLPQELWTEINQLLVGFGQQLQTESALVYTRACHSSTPSEAVKLVKSLGAKIDATNKKDPEKDTALITAIRQNDWNTFELLLQNGASPKAKNGNGKSAFDIAAEVGGKFNEHLENLKPVRGKRKAQPPATKKGEDDDDDDDESKDEDKVLEEATKKPKRRATRKRL